jgi:hypothetical protein
LEVIYSSLESSYSDMSNIADHNEYLEEYVTLIHDASTIYIASMVFVAFAQLWGAFSIVKYYILMKNLLLNMQSLHENTKML